MTKKENTMKKIILVMLLAILVLTMVACGGETTTAPGTTDEPSTTTTEPETTTTEPETTTSEEPVVENPPLYEEGENILNGNPDYMAIDPFTFNGVYPCSFEDFHEALDYEWAVVIRMSESTEMIYEQLIGSDPELEEGGDNWIINNQYKWIVVVNEKEYEVKKFSVQTGTTNGWVRLSLGAEFEPGEGNLKYDIRLKIYDTETDELTFWAWLTDPDLIGGDYMFNRPSADGMIVDPNVDLTKVEKFDSSYITIISGPEGNNAENYPNLFDKDIRTKLCSDKVETPIIFSIKDTVMQFNLQSISFVGANDDDPYDSRIVKAFKLYGATSDAEDAQWELLCDGSRASVDAINYQERNYDFQKDSSTYRFYKIELVHEGTFQIGEIVLYAEKDSVVVTP